MRKIAFTLVLMLVFGSAFAQSNKDSVKTSTQNTEVVITQPEFKGGIEKMYEYINDKGLSLYSGSKYDKVFFSKRKCEISIMAHLNEKFVDDFFAKNGYKVFYPERLTLIETIGIIQNARYLGGISSSLIHNQLFGHAKPNYYMY